jgi:hypothetical protein
MPSPYGGSEFEFRELFIDRNQIEGMEIES